tara:strand:- start:264 stop:1265 length:1002 start_codon:yes stop_codon:yes gene_type:complete
MQADTAAPIQSEPQVSQTQQTGYVAQTAAQAPVVSGNTQWVAPSQPMAAPAPQVQAQMGINNNPYNPTQYSPQPQQAAPQAENPYKDAFTKVVGLLSSPVQFPFQGQQSTQNQAIGQTNYASQTPTQYSNAVAPTYTPSTNNNQASSNNYSQTSQEITDQQLLANGVSEASLEVINHFGADAPAVLNNYACQIEDALITTNNQLAEAVGLLQEMSAEHKAYEQILTDPDVLADYTCEFFGPNGPYPVEEEQAGYANQGVQQRPLAGQPQAQAQAPARPEMPVPPQPQAPRNAGDFWNDFGTAADRDPQNAWKYLNAAQQNPEVFRQKLLVMDS